VSRSAGSVSAGDLAPSLEAVYARSLPDLALIFGGPSPPGGFSVHKYMRHSLVHPDLRRAQQIS